MTNLTCTEQQFLNDIREHEMTVIRNDGVNRHIRFKRPQEGAYWFDIITWPGTLCIDGDCGTYVFRRLDDMFKFFRTDREHGQKDGRTLFINPGYWGEKLQSVARQGGYVEFSDERFVAAIKDRFQSWCEDHEPDEATKDALWESIQDDVLFCENEHESLRAVYEFRHEPTGFEFTDFFEFCLTDYTFHFLWCCYAIAWGVKRYDTVQESVEVAQ